MRVALLGGTVAGCGETGILIERDAATEPPATPNALSPGKAAPAAASAETTASAQSSAPSKVGGRTSGSGADAPPIGTAPTDPEPAADASADLGAGDADPDELIAARARTPIYVEPDARSREIGYLRSGAVVERGKLHKGVDCAGGFYAIEPKGFVCATDVSVDADHALKSVLGRRPDRNSGLPYIYGRPRNLGPVLYNRVPSADEQRLREPEGRASLPNAWRGLLGELPDFLSEGKSSLRLDGRPRSELTVSAGRALSDSAFAFVTLFEASGRAYGLSTDLSLIPLDRLDMVTPSAFAGVPLGQELQLPLVFVRAKNATLFSGTPERGLRVVRTLDYREAVGLSGRRVQSAGRTLLETQSGDWLVDGPLLTHIDAVREPPPGRSQKTWVDVSIRRQTLVAYEGAQPVYATLVSTGADGLLDAETHRATVQGDFLIHTKHVTSTMDSDVEGDEYDLHDVPYVQYFSGGTALHAAFWHDAFGSPKSHGCINLSPLDARWLFDWSEPKVPQQWHGAMTVLGGTLVRVHP